MRKTYSHLQRIDRNRKIEKETDEAFIRHMEHALLLALLERGTLNAAQYRHATEKRAQRERRWD